MIPKKIHYCWFGNGEKPKLAQKCIASWEKYFPDFEIFEWNESNFDVYAHPYTKYCYENKKWAYLSDYARLKVVCEQGGIYFDTDVEVIRPFAELLDYDAFYGFENDDYVATGLGFAAVQKHKTVEAMLKQYDDLKPDETGCYKLTGCPALNTAALIPMGLHLNGEMQNVSGAVILPVEYLNPYDDPTGRLNKTKNTVSVHWYSKSALSKKAILRSKITRPFHRIFGKNCFDWLKKGKK
ncbi:MAG: glycosyl transferase [Oscillospiraceae bacterium]|nr:glycosyl transferase [Oscillospiraceae bacterium]